MKTLIGNDGRHDFPLCNFIVGGGKEREIGNTTKKMVASISSI
jgi:hypothetical protein